MFKDLFLWRVKDETRLPLAPSHVCGGNSIALTKYEYINLEVIGFLGLQKYFV
jgi:hypothetical protein